MSSLGDAPLNRKRKSNTAAQAEAEANQLTRKAHAIERMTDSGCNVPVPTQGMMNYLNSDGIAALAELLAMITDTAWLRIIPLHDEGITHWYVKWNKGKWANHYIYYAQLPSDSLRDCLAFLAIRFGEVERGERKPFRDARYSGK